jgi:CRP-like cAMP-binding protein
MKEIIYQFLKELKLFEEGEILKLMDQLPVAAYPKKQFIQHLGEVADKCFFVLKGCVRQFHLEDGMEKTTAFFTEGDAIVDFESFQHGTPSKHYWITVEDSILMSGTSEDEEKTYAEFPQLEQLTRKMMADNFGKMQQDFAGFISASPEERYLNLLENRPELILRVPQHQIASYLGMTPESLSRLKKRLQKK